MRAFTMFVVTSATLMTNRIISMKSSGPARRRRRGVIGLAMAMLLFATPTSVSAQSLPDNIDISGSPNGIVQLPGSVSSVFTNVFNRYTKIVAPNGKSIHFLLQSNVTDEKAVRAREVLRFFITDVPGTQYGADKTAVANRMADVDATLVFFNTFQQAQQAFNGPLGNSNLFMQDLYATESFVEGKPHYLNNTNRDATLEEVFHLVHGAGIEPILGVYHDEMTAAKNAAKAAGLYDPPPGLPVQDEVFEYIISVIDVYYGFWAHDPDGDGTSFGGEYAFNTQAAMVAGDPAGVTAMLKFLPPIFSFDCTVAASFSEMFTLQFSPFLEYTHKSQYLRDVSLSGALSSHLRGNALDNILGGNTADNTIDGGAGTDTAVFTGLRAEYTVQCGSSDITVIDTIPGRDGTDTLVSIESLQFADQTVPSVCIWDDLGGGTVGSNGAVTLVGTGSLVGGTTVSLDLTNAPANAQTLLWLSFTSSPLNFFGGTIHALPPITQLLFTVDGSGALSVSATWPVGVPAGTPVWFQNLVADPSVSWGITLSNGVLGTSQL
jgi:hypothetical protein